MADLGEPPAPQRPRLVEQIENASQPVVILVIILLSIRLTRRNLRRARADTGGAMRFAVFLAGLFLLGKALESHGLFTYAWAQEIWPLLVGATFVGVAGWSVYVAAEPLGRQVWPTMFVSSSRLLGRPRVDWRDPLIGKSVLVGLLAGGVVFTLIGPLRRTVTGWLTGEAPPPLGIDVALLQGTREALAVFLDQSMTVVMALVMVVALVVLQALVRRRGVAIALTLVVWTLISGVSSPAAAVGSLVMSAGALVVLLRWGVVAMVTSQVVLSLCWGARAGDWSAWTAEGPWIGIVLLTLLAVYGFWAATASSALTARSAAHAAP